jgi:hypothetical protein
MKVIRHFSRARTRGQALVEFALILPVLLMILMVLIEAARVFSAWLIVENVAREAARYAVTGQFTPAYCLPDPSYCNSGDPNYSDAAFDTARERTIQDIARGASGGILVDFDNPTRNSRSFYDLVICSSRIGFNYSHSTGYPACIRDSVHFKMTLAGRATRS